MRFSKSAHILALMVAQKCWCKLCVVISGQVEGERLAVARRACKTPQKCRAGIAVGAHLRAGLSLLRAMIRRAMHSRLDLREQFYSGNLLSANSIVIRGFTVVL